MPESANTTKSAISDLENARKLGADEETYVCLAEAYIRDGNYDGFSRTVQEGLDRFPDSESLGGFEDGYPLVFCGNGHRHLTLMIDPTTGEVYGYSGLSYVDDHTRCTVRKNERGNLYTKAVTTFDQDGNVIEEKKYERTI